MTPAKPAEKTFDQLCMILKGHFNPAPSEIVQSFRFHSRCLQASETVADYVAKLRRLSEHCNFGDTLNRPIRDQLVLGISDDKIQRRLLSEAGSLTLDKALDIAKGLEAAARGVEELSRAKTSEAAETVQKTIINGQRNDPTRKEGCAIAADPISTWRTRVVTTLMLASQVVLMTSIRGC